MTSVTQMHGKTLTFVRRAWLGIALLDVGLFVVGLLVWLPLLQRPCTEAAVVCLQRGQVTTAEFAAVSATGWSWPAFVWYNVLSEVAPKLFGVVVGFLIFWRKPDDRVAWGASLFLVIGLETSILDTLAANLPALWLLTSIISYIGAVCFGLFFYLFPNGRFVPKWSRWLAAAWALMFFSSNSFPNLRSTLTSRGRQRVSSAVRCL